MATVVLQTVGAALGGAIAGPFGALLGRAAGAAAGYALDQTYLTKDQVIQGPRLDSARVLSSQEGSSIPKIYGRTRISGQVIWATRFEEVASSKKTGGKGGGPKSTTTTYSYYANFAVGLCEGPISGIRRIWADGQEIDLTKIEYRFYKGDELQEPDPLIEAKQGLGNAPAYRGTAYVVFEGLPLENYGNRIPQLSFELINVIGKLEQQIKSMTVIPGSTEFGYDTQLVSNGGGNEAYQAFNRNTMIAGTDWKASIDELQMVCPNLETVALVVAWFGNDLRANECKIKPGVTTLIGGRWEVAGKKRYQAHLVSQQEGRPAYGGTPDDASVRRAIADLKSRGLKVVLYPFIMMDVVSDNALPGLSGQPQQPSYPWRGEISCYPQPGAEQTADKTATSRMQLDIFKIQYEELIIHYATLCAEAGGVDGFLIGSEMKGLTRVRDENNKFPFVETLINLAGQCRQVLGENTTITYAADWSEYFGYHPQDESGDVFFNLDPLWASDHIDAIGIDNYMPLADWRDEGDPENQYAGSPHSIDYLKSNITNGEGYDWYYRNSEERTAGIRTPITDGEGTPWVFKYKDIHSWWSNTHTNRINGEVQAETTQWVPYSKPFFFTELGCPAIDKGANQPNVFFDRKSTQSAVPYFSSGGRDDLIQRRFLEAHYEFWSDLENNPNSDQYNGQMVDVSSIAPWAWDARPFPWFPVNKSTWSDGENWHVGHWLTGRLGGCSLQDLVIIILEEFGCKNYEVQLDGIVDGYVIPNQSSARAVLEPLLELHNVRVVEKAGTIVFKQTSYADIVHLAPDSLVQEGDAPLKINKRLNELELPAEAVLSHLSILDEYEETKTKSRRLDGGSERQISLQAPVALSQPTALQLVETRLREDWISRNECRITHSTQQLNISPGDIIKLPEQDNHYWEVMGSEGGLKRNLTLRSIANFPKLSPQITSTGLEEIRVGLFGRPEVLILDLPLLKSSDRVRDLTHVAIAAKPWAGNYAIFSSPQEDGYKLRAGVEVQANIGRLLKPLSPGAIGLWDKRNIIEVSLPFGSLESSTRTGVLNGSNILAVESKEGGVEILQFANAELQDNGTWKLSHLLRAQLGSEQEMFLGADVGARVVILDETVVPIEVSEQEIGVQQNWRIGPAAELLTSDAYVSISTVNNSQSKKMLSPVHLRLSQTVDGSIDFSWVRRGRFDADNWDNAEIPMDAGMEQYILKLADSNGITVREITTQVPEYAYSKDMRITDFNSLETSFYASVAQISDNGRAGSFTKIKI